MTEYIDKKFIQKNSVEKRDYQINLAAQAINENCIVVLPTGLGKTTIALHVISEYLLKDFGTILFLAPTRVLVNQHFDFLQKNLTFDDIVLITGEDSVEKRKDLWNSRIICATPEVARNDMGNNIVKSNQFSLVIFDEVHRTTGDYAYSSIAEHFKNSSTRLLGMTATLPSEQEKATEILTRLRISSVAERNESSPDVKPYIQETNTEWINVELPPELKSIQKLLKSALDERYDILEKNGLPLNNQQSLSALLRLRPFVLSKSRKSAKPLFSGIRIHYALNILEVHGITPFLQFCKRAQEKKGVGGKDLFETDPNFTQALALAKKAQSNGIEHSKILKLKEILKSVPGKALIFTSYRDSVDMIYKQLIQMNIPAGILIGKAGETGLKQKKQIEVVQKFRDGEFQVLVATRVGEEGLDIAEVNQVIFYDNVPSSIRFVQRRGRTGRKDTGKLVILIAKDTIDETYYWIGKRKISAAKSMGSKMTTVLEKNKNPLVKSGLDAFI
ncbi:MAG: DEAD/DEAH box helicase family protein [Candidatus Nitrosopumilus limneticus]|nr:ERCC4 helicase [Candidatus Nitrosopumilus limneticus]MDC4212896.1 DEAD/DEAH box helicase family protein [Candidatus Nitrosopumilus limneticus]MDC4213833.1 DEAD/DEAH box helicase family protein [Candidatus Nitrosopumilus limneticus]MDC4215914.1 DEAD/DEAH box helicase family protein [Candidatus Nitrosopumilus limneticus]MDC4217001.1 DEAD/DEAH box helicase family protein [Candidatus Nitrosopumilus limneticus]